MYVQPIAYPVAIAVASELLLGCYGLRCCDDTYKNVMASPLELCDCIYLLIDVAATCC